MSNFFLLLMIKKPSKGDEGGVRTVAEAKLVPWISVW